MGDFCRGIKNAMLFVGTVVGAGFATGQEIALYFKGCDFLTVILSSAFLALFAFLFLSSGKIEIKSPILFHAYKAVMLISTVTVFGIMMAGTEELFRDYIGLEYIGILFGITCLLITAKGLDATKNTNLILVPILVVMIAVVAIKKGSFTICGQPKIFSGIGYAAMNMLFSGELMRKCGKEENRKNNLITAVFVFVMILLLITFMKLCIDGAETKSLPFVYQANQLGVGGFAFVAVALSIFTTMLSCGKISQDNLRDYWRKAPPYTVSFAVFAVGAFVSVFEFSSLINTVYPITSYMGIGLCIVFFFSLIFNRNKINLPIDK